MSSKNITPRKGDKFPAGRLDYTDIGKVIRVTTISGAVVTDELVALHSGDTRRLGGPNSRLLVGFRNVEPQMYDGMSERLFDVDPGLTVTVVALAKA